MSNRTASPASAELDALFALHGTKPSADKWNPIEEALYTPDPFTIAPKDAAAIRFDAILAGFTYQYEHNPFYRRFCSTAGIDPDILSRERDLSCVPVVPEHVFKGCSGPDQFVPWLASISSDEIRWPTSADLGHRSYDEQIAFLRREHNIHVRSTSGSSGVPSFLPRDPTTKRRSAHWKIVSYFGMYPEMKVSPDLVSVTLWPLDFSWADLMVPPDRVHALLDKELGLQTIIRAMTVAEPRGIVDRLLGRKGTSKGVAMLESLADQLEAIAGDHPNGIIWAPPFVLYSLATFLTERSRTLALGEGWRIELGGGWKLRHEKPLSEEELRVLASRAFGMRPEHIYDIYGSTESLGLCGLSCEGGYKHVPTTVLHPFVLDDRLRPVADGEWGRLAYLNPLIQAYPGFIVTGDRVRMWQTCPHCHRNGPVFDPIVTRMPGAEDRGCVNIIQELIEERI